MFQETHRDFSTKFIPGTAVLFPLNDNAMEWAHHNITQSYNAFAVAYEIPSEEWVTVKKQIEEAGLVIDD